MTAIVEGVYKQGKVELLQVPVDLPEGRVQVILIADNRNVAGQYLTFGMFPGDNSSLEEFRGAEWHGEKKFDEAE